MKFVQNIDAAVAHLGAQQPAIILNLASVPWESDEDRDTFLRYLAGRFA